MYIQNVCIDSNQSETKFTQITVQSPNQAKEKLTVSNHPDFVGITQFSFKIPRLKRCVQQTQRIRTLNMSQVLNHTHGKRLQKLYQFCVKHTLFESYGYGTF